MVSAAIVAATSTSKIRQLTVEVTVISMLSALVARIDSNSLVWICHTNTRRACDASNLNWIDNVS